MNVRRLAKGLALGGAALAVGAWAAGGRGSKLDEEMFLAGNRDRGAGADRVLRGMTELGSIWASLGAATVLAVARRRRAAVRGLAAASITWLAGQGLKRVFARPRPYDAGLAGASLRIGRPNGTSWPSSHPAVLLTFVTVAAKEVGARRSSRAALDVLAGAIGASRVYVGVHYPSDVVGGLLVGKGVAAAFDGRA